MSEKTVSEVLRLAADYLETHGWNDHPQQTVDGPCCALQAIFRVANANSISGSWAGRFMFAFLGEPVSTWNDSQYDAATVIAALRSAASAAEGASAQQEPTREA